MRLQSKYSILLFIILGCLPLFALAKPGLPLTHDGPDHVARIANFYQALTEGKLIPRWAGNLNWGYGHPILMFLYPLPSYFAAFFRVLGFNFVDSTKLVFGFAYLLSVLAMFMWLRAWLGGLAAIVGAVLYGFAPYRFVDLYVRGAIGEHVAFIFPPLICLSLFGLSRKKQKWWGMALSFSTAGLILAHNAVSLMFLPVIAVYALYLYFIETKRNLPFLLKATSYLLLGFGLSSFYWFPALVEGKYTLREIVTNLDYSGRFVPWSKFIYSTWNYGGGNELSKQIGWGGLVSIAAAFYFVRRSKLLIGLLLLLLFSLWIQTAQASFFWRNISLIQKFQFPWRFLSLTVFVSAVIGAVWISLIAPKKRLMMVVVLSALAVLTTIGMWKPKAYLIKPESYYSGIYPSTTDTGESSPIWSVRFMEAVPQADIEVIVGQAEIQPLERKSFLHRYLVKVLEKSRLVENTLYFPGWKVLASGQPLVLEFQDPAYRGLMTFWLEPGEYEIVVKFGETRLRQIANLVSVVSLVTLCLIYPWPWPFITRKKI